MKQSVANITVRGCRCITTRKTLHLGCNVHGNGEKKAIKVAKCPIIADKLASSSSMHSGGAHAYAIIVLVRHDVLASSLFFTSRLAPIHISHTLLSNKK